MPTFPVSSTNLWLLHRRRSRMIQHYPPPVTSNKFPFFIWEKREEFLLFLWWCSVTENILWSANGEKVSKRSWLPWCHRMIMSDYSCPIFFNLAHLSWSYYFISPTPAPTGHWTSDGYTVLIEIIVFSVLGGLLGLVLIHYIIMYALICKWRKDSKRLHDDLYLSSYIWQVSGEATKEKNWRTTCGTSRSWRNRSSKPRRQRQRILR